MSNYPNYINHLLAQAKRLAENPFEQPEAAAICFDILTLFPEHEEASELIFQLFCDRKLVREQRKAISRLIDEWDDRDWQQRRRLALSFRHMSRWAEQHQELEDGESQTPAEIADMLSEGKKQLLQDYLLGQSKGSDAAWSIFQAAIQRSNDPERTMLWVGELYAKQGFFAEGVEVLEDLATQFPKNQLGKRLWVEVRWWRDNQNRIPWIPPASAENGRRYRRMMADVDPGFATAKSPLEHRPPNWENLPDDFSLPSSLSEDLVGQITAVLNQIPPFITDENRHVNWHYLDLLESGDIDVTAFPEWAQYLLLDIDDPQQEQFLKRYLLELLSNLSLSDEEE